MSWSEEKRGKFEELVKAGVKAVEIAKELGETKQAVNYYLKKRGVGGEPVKTPVKTFVVKTLPVGEAVKTLPSGLDRGKRIMDGAYEELERLRGK